MKKAQSAIEFIILLSAVMVFFILALFYFQQNMQIKEKESTNTLVKDIAAQVQDEISLAAKASEGYKRTFNLPPTILGRNYSINISQNLVYLVTSDGKFAIALPVESTNGTLEKGKNTIIKLNGYIFLNPN